MKRTLLCLFAVSALFAQTPNARLSLTVNQGRQADVFQGWPMVARVRAINPVASQPAESSQVIVIDGGDQPWTSALVLDIRSSNGEVQNWPLHLAGKPPQSVSLGAAQAVEAIYYLSGDDTAQLAPGDYVVTFRMGAESTWARLRIAPEPGSLTPEQDFARAMAGASYGLAAGDLDSGLAALADLLTRQPQNTAALLLEGDILGSQGKSDQAAAAYAQASAAYSSLPDTSKREPPSRLLSRQVFTY